MVRKSLLLALLLILSPAAAAGIIAVSAFDSGHYRPDGEHFSANRNYTVGKIALVGDIPVDLRNFFLFEINTTQQIVAATLWLSAGDVLGADWYFLTDLTIDPLIVQASHARGDPAGQSVYNDLAAGSFYANAFVSNQSGTLGIALNDKAVEDLNASTNIFGIGGYMSSNTTTAAFLATNGSEPLLILETVETLEEPPSLPLMLSALAFMLVFTTRPPQ